jgi:hypothetical protein
MAIIGCSLAAVAGCADQGRVHNLPGVADRVVVESRSGCLPLAAFVPDIPFRLPAGGDDHDGSARCTWLPAGPGIRVEFEVTVPDRPDGSVAVVDLGTPFDGGTPSLPSGLPAGATVLRLIERTETDHPTAAHLAEECGFDADEWFQNLAGSTDLPQVSCTAPIWSTVELASAYDALERVIRDEERVSYWGMSLGATRLAATVGPEGLNRLTAIDPGPPEGTGTGEVAELRGISARSAFGCGPVPQVCPSPFASRSETVRDGLALAAWAGLSPQARKAQGLTESTSEHDLDELVRRALRLDRSGAATPQTYSYLADICQLYPARRGSEEFDTGSVEGSIDSAIERTLACGERSDPGVISLEGACVLVNTNDPVNGRAGDLWSKAGAEVRPVEGEPEPGWTARQGGLMETGCA